MTQPNIIYNDKVEDIELIDSLLKEFNRVISTNTKIILLPELLLSDNYWKETFLETAVYAKLKYYLLNKHPNATILIGNKLRMISNEIDTNSSYSQEYNGIPSYGFNVCSAIDTSNKISYKAKKLFITKVENWPPLFNAIFPDKKAIINNYASTNDADIMRIGKQNYFIAICYESIFSDQCVIASKEDCSAIIMLASESFLKGNNFAIEQYLNICKLKAIENQKYVVKCSNSGISATINPIGEIETELRSDISAYKLINLPLKHQKTFFSKICF